MKKTNLAIQINSMYKYFPLYSSSKDIIKDLFRFKKSEQKIYKALKNINLEVQKGSVIGIVGLNGSGKSTLSSIIAGVSTQTLGEVRVEGKVAMLSAQSGLNQNLTGIQNIEYKCILMGLSKNKINTIKEEIISFAELGEFIHQPIKRYSSGMKARLGFAISLYMDPDILIIDEGLAVGDSSFSNKCFEKIERFKLRGKTIIYISHSVSTMKSFCDKVLWLHKGEIIEYGNTNDIVDQYILFSKYYNNLSQTEKNEYTPKMEKFDFKDSIIKIEGKKVIVEIDAYPKEQCRYAFEIFKNNNKILKREYSEKSILTYDIQSEGIYRIKYYVRYEDKTIRDFIIWPNGKSSYEFS